MNILRHATTAFALTIFTAPAAFAAGSSIDPSPYNAMDIPPERADSFDPGRDSDMETLKSYYTRIFVNKGWSNVQDFSYRPKAGLLEFHAKHPDGGIYTVTARSARGEVEEIIRASEN